MDWNQWRTNFHTGPGADPFGAGMEWDLRPFLKPLMSLSPIRMLTTAVAIIVLSGVAVSAFAALLTALFFLALLIESILKADVISAHAEPQ